MNDKNIKLFKKVHCKSYLKRIYDGTHIVIYDQHGYVNSENTEAGKIVNAECKAFAITNHGEVDLEFDGSSVKKRYYEKAEKEFDGFIVGTKDITVSGQIGTDWYEDDYQFYRYCFKNPEEIVKCGVVYFQNNRKRYVPMEDIEEVDA
jgi:hypothetical protein